MRHKGKSLKGPKTETLVIPREPTYQEGSGAGEKIRIDNDVVFIAQAVLDFDEFEVIDPPPVPPNMIRPGNPPQQTPNTEDPDYKEHVHRWAKRKRDWMVLKSLAPSPDIEWEQVNMLVPDTYHLYYEELKESGFNQQEINLIVGLALKVNSVDEDKMEEARQRFLASQAVKVQS